MNLQRKNRHHDGVCFEILGTFWEILCMLGTFTIIVKRLIYTEFPKKCPKSLHEDHVSSWRSIRKFISKTDQSSANLQICPNPQF